MNRVDLPALAGPRLGGMPWTHRVLLENLARHAAHEADAEAALTRWLGFGERDFEMPFRPLRVLMHDTTCGPALVDLASLRTTIAEHGGDPATIRPGLRVDVSTDHSLAVDVAGTPDAAALNAAHELRRNRERFAFMKWAGAAMANLHVHPPGTGIMHTINLEQLATLVAEHEFGGQRWLVPDTLIGTDSHTPMVNGIGVLGWGVGGLEAESVMLGQPIVLRLPRVVGVRFDGALGPGVTATDLALTITARLRRARLNGRFVEFFGGGVAALAAGTRCVVANMAPEYGGATGYFAPDTATLAYLAQTGRDPASLARAEAYCREQQLWFDPAAAPDYDEVIVVNLDEVRRSIAGPHRPQDLHRLAEAPCAPVGPARTSSRPIVIAAITSCTNTSDPRLLIAAGLVARKARQLGLAPPPWVKTSLAPGSPAAAGYLARTGLLEDLEALGFAIVGTGCATCIGNSGPLNAAATTLLAAPNTHPVAVLSGNRNFPGRVHADVTDAFLASPPLVVAYALSGAFDRSLDREPIARAADGRDVHLADLWPCEAEIDATLDAALQPGEFRRAFQAAAANPQWAALPAPSGATYPWDAASTYLRPPPFVAPEALPRLGTYDAHPLLVLGDDVTTDHISPAGAIPATSEAGGYLIERGEHPDDLNAFAARRGNWEVMLRGLFTNRAVHNLLAPGLTPGTTLHIPSGEVLPLWRAAGRYREERVPLVIVAGERYGMGSSRDWAAKGTYLLGVRAVLAVSFEPIHRANLVNMGVLPLLLPDDVTPGSLNLAAGDTLRIAAEPAALSPGATVLVSVLRKAGESQQIATRAAIETGVELAMLRGGGLLPVIARAALGIDSVMTDMAT